MVEVIEQETGQTLSISQGEIILVTASSAVSQNVVTVALDTQFSCLHFFAAMHRQTYGMIYTESLI